jgi:uncharacterized protein YaaR (DUF327 family)
LKVKQVNIPETGLTGPRSADNSRLPASQQLVFQRTLSQLSGDQLRAQLNSLAAAIDEQGRRLAKRADIKEFEKYRALIKQFLDEVVSNGYAFNKDSTSPSRGRYRTLATVKTVNDKLDDLARIVLAGQADNLELLRRMGEIRGLLLDMML